MASTNFSEQHALSLIAGNAPTKRTVQEMANIQKGTAGKQLSLQVILNRGLGVSDTKYTEQQALFRRLQTKLSLTGSDTRYSVQELLNMAYAANVLMTDIFV